MQVGERFKGFRTLLSRFGFEDEDDRPALGFPPSSDFGETSRRGKGEFKGESLWLARLLRVADPRSGD